jgi:putative spermidine/putrescine transport system substrate-binding protein
MKPSNKLIGVTAIVACLATISSLAYAGGSITFTSWGGTTQDAQKHAWADKFEAATNIKVLEDGPTDYGKLKAMIDSGNTAWDVVDVEGDYAYQAAKDGLLEPLDFSVISKADTDPRFVFDHGIGSFYYSFVLGYNQDSLKGPAPKTWADLFDTTKFPGKRTFYKWSAPGVLEIALLADGVAPDKLYPLDLDRAFKKLDSIKKDILWWGTGAESQQQLAAGEAPLGMFWNGRIYALQQDGAHIGVSWEQNVATADYLVVPKGSKNKEAAMKFIAMASSAQGQADLANATAYAPVNVKSEGLLAKGLIPLLPSKNATGQITLDLNYWAAHRDEIGKRWYAWQAQ